MRNTLQYPITKDEVISALENAITEELGKRLVGGIRPAALVKAKEFILAHGPEIFYEPFDSRSAI